VDIVVVGRSVLGGWLGVVAWFCRYCRSGKVVLWGEELCDEKDGLYLLT
jgi:hypothetical protein